MHEAVLEQKHECMYRWVLVAEAQLASDIWKPFGHSDDISGFFDEGTRVQIIINKMSKFSANLKSSFLQWGGSF